MKKVLAFAIGTTFATVAMPSFALEQYLDYVDVQVAATYTKPSNNGMSFLIYQTQFPALFGFERNRWAFLNPSFKWDYALGLSFHVPETCTRLYAEYDNYNNSDERQMYATNFDDQVSGRYVVGDVRARSLQKSHEWRFGFKRFIPFGNCFSTELSGFWEYDKVSQSMHTFVSFDNQSGESGPIQKIYAYAEQNVSFRGWGPGLGLRFRGIPFQFCSNLGLYAQVSTTLFYAKNLFNTSEWALEQRRYYFDPENSRSITGKYDIHLGLDYLRVFRVNGCPINTGLTLGVRYMNIINAFKNGNTFAQELINVDGVFFPVMGVPNDWGRVGPYLRFNIGGGNA